VADRTFTFNNEKLTITTTGSFVVVTNIQEAVCQ
jgi:hypothetical protein